MMKWIAIICVIAIACVCYNQFISTFPRATGKWPQTLYDHELAYCMTHGSQKNCECAVGKSEDKLPFDEALGMEQKAGETQDSDPVYQRVSESFAECGVNGAAQTASTVHFDPQAGKGGVVNDGETEKGRNGVSHRVMFDPKTGTWSN